MILNLSYGVTINGMHHPSVNESTKPNIAPSHALTKLSHILPGLIYAVTTAPNNKGPILFSKLGIKDGYWQMVVNPDDEWNFTYVLPKLSSDKPTHLVILSCLQMGWCESASYFCAGSKTACDVGTTLTQHPIRSLPAHPLEHHLMPTHPATDTPEDSQQSDTLDNDSISKFLHLIKVYINDFIQLTQTTNPTQLLHLLHALLHAIHSMFPPLSVTEGKEEDPVPLKKLLQGDGLWATCKELLGWIFDGVKCCIELPDSKHECIQLELCTV